MHAWVGRRHSNRASLDTGAHLVEAARDGQAEVADLEGAVPVPEQVVRLDVHDNDAVAVQELQPLERTQQRLLSSRPRMVQAVHAWAGGEAGLLTWAASQRTCHTISSRHTWPASDSCSRHSTLAPMLSRSSSSLPCCRGMHAWHAVPPV